MLHDFNIRQWISQQLPIVLRGKLLMELIWVMLKPLQDISDKYSEYAQLAELKMRHNGHTQILQHWINEQLHQPLGTIYISEFINNLQYLYYRDERAEGVYMSYENEGDGLYLSSSPPIVYGGFLVNVPEYLATEENLATITQWVDFYKYAGTSYKINIV